MSGLAAAWELLGLGARVTVLEAADRPGGLLRSAEVAGVVVDLGAEATLARRPELLALADEVGLGGRRVDPTATGSMIWTSRGPRPLPTGTVMGVPAGPDAVAAMAELLAPRELVETRELAARSAAQPAPRPESDVAVGEAVAAHVGRPVVDAVVEPLLGGVYAGHADHLSLAATVPALWREWLPGRSLVDAAAAVLSGGGVSGPVFAGLDGGMAGLATALVDRLTAGGVQVRTRAAVTEVSRVADRWRVEVAGTEPLAADVVVVALPVAAAADVLRGVCPTAAQELDRVETADVATVALAVPESALDGVAGSGLLVPPRAARTAGVTVKAVTYSSRKWSWVGRQRPGVAVVRASLGRAGESAALERDDEEVVELAGQDTGRLLGRPVPVLDAVVARWPGSLPQYAVGHLDRVERVRGALFALPGLAMAGNVLDGVGLPACAAAGRRAARDAVSRSAGAETTRR